jgi:hypothetical protein
MELCQAFVDARCARLVNKKAAASFRELMHHAYVFQQIIPTSVGAKCANRRYPSAAKKNPAHDARRVLKVPNGHDEPKQRGRINPNQSQEGGGRLLVPGRESAAAPLCPRCRNSRMVEVVSIAPRLDEPGLIAYQCPACEHAISILQHQQERGPAPYR